MAGEPADPARVCLFLAFGLWLIPRALSGDSWTVKGLARLEARRQTPGLPVVVLSQYVEQLYARELLALMAEGCSNSAIAQRLLVTEKAVGKHTTGIFAKLGLAPANDDNRRVLAVLAYLNS